MPWTTLSGAKSATYNHPLAMTAHLAFTTRMKAAMRPTQGVQTYAGGTTYSPGTILEATDSVSGVTNYYKARVVSTNKDPANAQS